MKHLSITMTNSTVLYLEDKEWGYFARRFKGKTILYMFLYNGSPQSDEECCFIALQVYISYNLSLIF